jgi:tetratricopeptide (TPR) repeat protein
MLFDLRGSGRRTTVKVVYVTLAILMGGGLVFFGIGGSVSGGLFDAITGSNSGASSDEGTFVKRAAAADRAAKANPQDPAAWAEVVRARYQLARAGDNVDPNTRQFTAAGVAQLKLADAAWQKHLALKPDPPDDSVATIMVRAYTQGLNDPVKATAAQEIVAEERPKSGTYADLAALAFAAGQISKGDLATKKALELADPDDRETLKAELKEAKQQGLAQAIQNQATPTPTATPKAKDKKKSDTKD